jgi:hypothetical protein
MMNRRTYLTSVASLAGLAVAGCVDQPPEQPPIQYRQTGYRTGRYARGAK